MPLMHSERRSFSKVNVQPEEQQQQRQIASCGSGVGRQLVPFILRAISSQELRKPNAFDIEAL